MGNHQCQEAQAVQGETTKGTVWMKGIQSNVSL